MHFTQPTVLHERKPVLGGHGAKGCIFIEGIPLYRVYNRERLRTIIDNGHAAAGTADDRGDRTGYQGEWICDHADAFASKIPDIREAEKGQLQIGSGAHTPDPHRLTKVCFVVRKTPYLGDVKYSKATDSGIDREALHRVPATAHIALQDVVDENRRFLHVGKEMMYAMPGSVRDIGHIELGHRSEEMVIDIHVAGEHRSIGGRRGIMRGKIRLVMRTARQGSYRQENRHEASGGRDKQSHDN